MSLSTLSVLQWKNVVKTTLENCMSSDSDILHTVSDQCLDDLNFSANSGYALFFRFAIIAVGKACQHNI